MSFRTLTDGFLRLFPETLDEVVLVGGCLDLVPDRVEHLAVGPIAGVADLIEILPCLHVVEHTTLVGLVFPCCVDLREDAGLRGRREFRMERVRVFRNFATMDVLAVVVEGMASSVDAVGCRESTPAGFTFRTLAFEVLMEAAFAALVTFFFALADTAGQETSAFACGTSRCETLDFPLTITLLSLLSSDADAAPRFAFTTTAVA